jgi:hypothetical protein
MSGDFPPAAIASADPLEAGDASVAKLFDDRVAQLTTAAQDQRKVKFRYAKPMRERRLADRAELGTDPSPEIILDNQAGRGSGLFPP